MCFSCIPLLYFYGGKEENCCDVVSKESFAKRKKEKVFQIYMERQGKWNGVCFGYHEVRTVKCVVSILESKGGVFFFDSKKAQDYFRHYKTRGADL